MGLVSIDLVAQIFAQLLYTDIVLSPPGFRQPARQCQTESRKSERELHLIWVLSALQWTLQMPIARALGVGKKYTSHSHSTPSAGCHFYRTEKFYAVPAHCLIIHPLQHKCLILLWMVY